MLSVSSSRSPLIKLSYNYLPNQHKFLLFAVANIDIVSQHFLGGAFQNKTLQTKFLLISKWLGRDAWFIQFQDYY
jgi:hypothetical protein